tara:strand:- start:297 stop:1151 length:855 start_codon:yes stop_codon:yes gene_type:complete
MIKKMQVITSSFHYKSIFSLLLIFILPVNADTKIIAKEGDTLLKISKQYRVPLKELMHKNNFNNANRKVEGEVIIIPLHNNKKGKKSRTLNYTVKEGDTLYKIARNYNINVEDIISINNLDKATFLKPNQIILIPNDAIHEESFDQKHIKLASKKVFYHQTSKVEKIIDIAKLHRVSREDIIILNKLKDPVNVRPNTKLKIRKTNPLKWLKYGSLTIDWTGWRYLDGNYITQAKNRKNKPFYLAVNCERRALNNTLKNSYWNDWYFPKSNFEFRLINDFCDQSF